MNNQKSRYRTKQEAVIIGFFKDNSTKHFTADEVCTALASEGVSRATVYRRIERLVEDGELLKFNFGTGTGACYQFCSKEHECTTFHFICTKCKSLHHLDCSVISEIQQHLISNHNLLIDESRTVFYGLCERCL